MTIEQLMNYINFMLNQRTNVRDLGARLGRLGFKSTQITARLPALTSANKQAKAEVFDFGEDLFMGKQG